MDKTQAWVALFNPEHKEGVDLEQMLATVAGDKEPDADADAAFDDATRDRIRDFLMDADAFCQANSSDSRVGFWRRLIAVSAPVAKPVTPHKARLNVNALAVAERATTTPVAPTLSLGNATPPVVAPVVHQAPAPVVPQAPAPTPTPTPTASPQPVAGAPATVKPAPAAVKLAPAPAAVTPAPAAPTSPVPVASPATASRQAVGSTIAVTASMTSDDPIVLTERAITGLIIQGKIPSADLRKKLRKEAEQAARAIARRTEGAANRKKRKDEADRLAALEEARKPSPELLGILNDPLYITFRKRYLDAYEKLRSADEAEQAKGRALLASGRPLLETWRDDDAGGERALIARHILRMLDALRKGTDMSEPKWFNCNFVTGKWEATRP